MAFRNVFNRSLEGVAQLPNSFSQTFGNMFRQSLEGVKRRLQVLSSESRSA